ncbi:MAG: isochorismate synthase [Halobacteriales archaeon]
MDRPASGSRAATVAPSRSRAVEIADVSFRAFLESRDPPRIQWATAEGLEVVAAGAAVRIAPAGDRFRRLRRRAGEAFAGLDFEGPAVARPRAFGGLSFFSDHEPSSPWRGFPAASFVVPTIQLTRADGHTYLTVTGVEDAIDDRLDDARAAVADLPAMQPTGRPPGVVATRQHPGEPAWTDQVGRTVEHIRSDGLRKVVLATALDVDLAASPSVPAILERLRRTYPDCYRFLVQPTQGAAFFGAPPERLVRLDGREMRTEALAGSVERGDTPDEDAALAASLAEGEKLREEQRLVADAIREWLDPLGDVRVGDRTVRKLTNIQHLQTPIRATLSADAHVLSVVEALHPTPAVGGVPREAALALIRETETFDRGWYAAPVGWFDADGDGEFAVAIRAAVADGDRGRLFAGNGIVADSDPAEEWAEIQPKYRPILDELRRARTD